MTYSKTVIHGISWMGALQVFLRGLVFIKFIVMAKVLSPYALGLFGIANLSIGLLESVTDFGIPLFLIQHKGEEREYIDSVWIVSIARGALLTIILIIFSYPIALFFKQTAALPLLIGISFLPFVNGLESPTVVRFQKQLTFHKEFFFRTVNGIVDVIFAITWLFVFHSVIGLVYSLIFASLVESLLSFFIAKPIPKFTIDFEKLKEVLHYSKWIALAGTASYFSTQIDSIVVGRMLGASDLGIYQIVQGFSLRIISEGVDVVSKVMFPIFAKLQGDKKQLFTMFKNILLLIGIPSFVIAGIMVFFAHPLLLFFGKSWTTNGEISFKLFALLGFIMALMSIITSLFLGVGKQDLTTKLVIARVIFLAVFIIPLTKLYGMTGAATASLVSFLLIYPSAIIFLKRLYKSYT